MCNLHETQPSFRQDSNWKSLKDQRLNQNMNYGRLQLNKGFL